MPALIKEHRRAGVAPSSPAGAGDATTQTKRARAIPLDVNAGPPGGAVAAVFDARASACDKIVPGLLTKRQFTPPTIS